MKRVTTWITNFTDSGGTNPKDSLIRALALRPDAVFFLTDGAFDAGIVDIVRQLNTRRASINTVGFGDHAGADLLKRIAEQNNGRYILIP